MTASADITAAFDESPPAEPEALTLPSSLCRCVSGAPTLPCGRVVGAYRREMTREQEDQERVRNEIELRAAISGARAACDRMRARVVLPRGAALPDPVASARAALTEARTVAATGGRKAIADALARVEEALR